MRIREIAQSRVRYGYRKIRVLLNREGWNVGKYLVYRLYKQEQGRIALIGLDENDTTAKALAFAHAKGVTYTLGFDPLVTVADAYNIDGLPQTFFLNAQHRIVERVLGAVTKADLAQGVALMNAQGTPSEKVIEPS